MFLFTSTSTVSLEVGKKLITSLIKEITVTKVTHYAEAPAKAKR